MKTSKPIRVIIILFTLLCALAAALCIPTEQATFNYIYAPALKNTDVSSIETEETILRGLVFQLNNDKADFTIIANNTSDFENKEKFADFVDIFNGLKKDWYLTISDNNSSFSEDDAQTVLKEKKLNNFFDTPYYTFQPKKNFHFISLPGKNGLITEEETEFLKKTLADKNKNSFFVIFSSAELIKNFEPDHTLENKKDKLFSVMYKSKGPVIVISPGKKIFLDEEKFVRLSPPSFNNERFFITFKIIKYINRTYIDINSKYILMDSPQNFIFSEKMGEYEYKRTLKTF